MTPIELIVDAEAGKALRCLYETLIKFDIHELTVNEQLKTLHFERNSDLGLTVLHYFITVTPLSYTKSQLRIYGDYKANVAGKGEIIEFVSKVLDRFSKRL